MATARVKARARTFTPLAPVMYYAPIYIAYMRQQAGQLVFVPFHESKYLYGFCVAYTDIRALRTIIRKHTLVSGPQTVSSTFRRLIINKNFSAYESARKVVCGSIDIKYSGVSMVH